jgi:rfaE bifunctional protein nucleotidyltransferase chain/domain
MAPATRLVLASGCFDVLHIGHVAFLEAARACGDYLVVSVTSDEYVRRAKGPGHPFFPVAERYRMLYALRCVDRVVISEAEDAVIWIRRVKPAVYAKGTDYSNGDPTGRLAREQAAVEALGGEMVLLDSWPKYSSTAIMKALA